jgi:AraC-like DNA-binding protein
VTRIRAGAALGILEGVSARAASPERVLAAAGLTAPELADPDRMLELERVLRLTEAAARETGDDTFGLHQGLGWDLGGGLGVLSYAVLNAPTVGTALRNFERYGRTHIQGGRIGLAHEGDEALLVYELGVADHELARQHVEGAAAVALRILRRLIGPDFRPRRVLFAHRRPREVSELARVFDAPLRFEQRFDAALAFPAAALERGVAGADRRLLPIVERHLDELLASDAQDAWLQQVRTQIAGSLCDGAPDIARVAKQLGMSVRTFQRRLDEHGAVWKTLVAAIRRDLAQRYLADGTASLTEIAFLLGYSELSAFDRAFRRWTGSTPLAMRRSLRASA